MFVPPRRGHQPWPALLDVVDATSDVGGRSTPEAPRGPARRQRAGRRPRSQQMSRTSAGARVRPRIAGLARCPCCGPDSTRHLLNDWSGTSSERDRRGLRRPCRRGAQMSAVPTRVAVIGGGRMGAGIAQVFLAAGAQVAVVEAGGDAAEAARGRVADGLDEAARRGKLDGDAATALARLTLLDSAAELEPATGLVVEAVPERADLKAE